MKPSRLIVLGFVLVLLSVSLVACGGPGETPTPPPPPPPPPSATAPPAPTATPVPPPSSTPVPTPTAIPQPSISFSADATRVEEGQCTNIHWDVEQAKSVYLQYGSKSEGVPGQGSKQVCPSRDGKRYILDVTGEDGQQQTREIQINISNPSVAIKFWSDDKEVTIGECTVVRWNVSNSKEVEFNDGNGYQDVSANSSEQVCPAYPTDYKLRVTDLNGKTHDRTVSIKTKAPPPGLITPEPTKEPLVQ